MSLNTAEGNFEYVIWSNEYLDWADWQEAFDGEFDHCSDEEKYRLMSNLNNDYLEDDRNEMNVCVGSPIIIIADIGKWDGRHTGYREIESGCLKDCLYTELDGVTWYVDNKSQTQSTRSIRLSVLLAICLQSVREWQTRAIHRYPSEAVKAVQRLSGLPDRKR